jgi:hypothetical protein
MVSKSLDCAAALVRWLFAGGDDGTGKVTSLELDPDSLEIARSFHP